MAEPHTHSPRPSAHLKSEPKQQHPHCTYLIRKHQKSVGQALHYNLLQIIYGCVFINDQGVLQLIVLIHVVAESISSSGFT